MIQSLNSLEQFLKNNRMEGTLQSLRAQIMNKFPQKPSRQFLNMINEEQKVTHPRVVEKPFKKNKKKQEMVAQNLLSKIAYSSKLLEDPTLNKKVNSLMQNKIFQKAAKKLFPPSISESESQYHDQLQFATVNKPPTQYENNNSNNYSNNHLSVIDINQDESSIISQPSYILEELDKSQLHDQYNDDNDVGYYQYAFSENQLLNGCATLTQKYGYPQFAIKKGTKKSTIIQKKNRKKGQSKFHQGIIFPASQDQNYPLQFNGVIYDIFKIKVIYNRQKTGYETEQQLKFKQGDILAGKYRVDGVLGSGVFAKVLKVYNIKRNQATCLKMISNNKDPHTNIYNKDFFDQALDQIKILKFIGANCQPDQHYLLNFKGVFYHRQHLFIQTDILLDNLFFAYRKNPSFFSIPVIKMISRQILEALRVLHSLQIIHADLKPENVLIKTYYPVQVKVIDLGNSCFLFDHLGSYVQSRSYRAPEVVLGLGYDEKIDIWSVGCILAQLWTKNVLFYNVHIQGMLARIQSILGPWPEWMLEKGQAVSNYFSKQNLLFYEQSQKINILIPKYTNLSNRIRTDDIEFLSFLTGLLKIDPTQRLSAEQALKHPFLQS